MKDYSECNRGGAAEMSVSASQCSAAVACALVDTVHVCKWYSIHSLKQSRILRNMRPVHCTGFETVY
jgi:hypothetical protein